MRFIGRKTKERQSSSSSSHSGLGFKVSVAFGAGRRETVVQEGSLLAAQPPLVSRGLNLTHDGCASS